jgi:4'-phosphopantetheinyl transferase
MESSIHPRTQWSAIRLPLELSPEIVHVIRLRLDLDPVCWNEMRQYLTDDELARADRFRFDGPRRQFIVCRATLRQLLGSCCGVAPGEVPLKYSNRGKPYLSFDGLNAQTPHIEFSVSHSGDLGLIAITLEVIVGIDVEECNPKVKTEGLAKRYFAPAEVEELSTLAETEQLAGFYRGWTCKEAYIKATGRGLSMPLDSFAVSIDPKKPASLLHVDDMPDEPNRWSIQALDVAEHYAGAVMVARPDCQFEYWNWPSD